MAITDMPSAAPGRKILATGAGGSFALLLANLLLWVLDTFAFEPDVVDSVPGPVEAFVLGALPLAAALVAGYLTPRSADEIAPPHRPGQHVRRVDDEAGSARLPDPGDALALVLAVALLVFVALFLASSWR